VSIELISHLRIQITNHFNTADLQTLCFELEVKYEDIRSEVFNTTVINIIEHCNRHGLLDDLIKYCEKERPRLIWRTPPDVSLSTSQSKEMSFVILAMTKSQVQELLDETIFADPNVAPITKSRFTQHKKLLVKSGVGNFQELYGATPEEWKPHKHSGLSIKQIVQKALEHHKDNSKQTDHILSPKFVTEDFCSSMETETYKVTKKSLEKQGGMIIVDAISLHHPYIYNKLSNSGLLTNKKIAILILSPMNESTEMNNDLVQEIIQSNMNYVFERFAQDADPSCEIVMGDINSFKRWFMNALYRISIEKQKMPEINKERLANIVSHEPRGMTPKFAG
jgi:hypothetical protein